MTAIDPLAEAALFDVEQPPPVSLADKFGVPPMSVLDRRSGEWQSRKRQWRALGMASEVGRTARAVGLTTAADGTARQDFVARLMRGEEDGPIGKLAADGTSIFDPVICELVYRWFSRPGAIILDPFAGGSVRGVVASTLARWYFGVDVREEQIDANKSQAHLGSDIRPTWLLGDATRLHEVEGIPNGVDLIFSCPPYGDLEVYSDDPRDISTWPYEQFQLGHAKAIRDAVGLLRSDRYAAWVISDIRDKRGAYRSLVGETIRAFASAGASLLNDFVILDQVGTAAIRAERPFVANRKATRVHQSLLIFVKGDIKRAAQWVSA